MKNMLQPDSVQLGLRSIADARQTPLLSIMCGKSGINWRTVDSMYNSLHGIELAKLDLLIQANDSDYDVISQTLEILKKSVDELHVIIPAPLVRLSGLIALSSSSITLGTFGSITPITPGYDPNTPENSEKTISHFSVNGFNVVNKLQFDAIETLQCRIIDASGDNVSVKDAWDIAASFVSETSEVIDEKTANNYDSVNATIDAVKRALDIGNCVSGENDEIAKKLVTGFSNPNQFIRFDELKAMGFNVNRADEDLDFTLYELSAQPDSIQSPDVRFISMDDKN